MKQAHESVHSSGYKYKKEKTGWQMVDESDTETLPTPKCPKMDAEMKKTLKHLTSRWAITKNDCKMPNQQKVWSVRWSVRWSARKFTATCHRKRVQTNAQLQAGQVPTRTQPNMQEQANIHTKWDNCDHLWYGVMSCMLTLTLNWNSFLC